MYPVLHILSALYGGYIIYNLSLLFVGVDITIKKSLIPVVIYGVLMYLYKYFLFNSLPALHTMVIAATCILLIKFFNKIPFYLSLIGVIATFIIIIFASNLVISPLALLCGFDITSELSNNFDWIMLSFLETTPALLILIFLRVSKISIFNFLNNI